MPTITLNDRKIAGLKPTGKQVDYFDRSFPGFGLRLSQSGGKSFFLMYRKPDKKLARLTIGTYGAHPPDVTLAKAREEARKQLEKISIGRDPGAERKQAKQNTVEALCADYIARHAQKRKRTWRDDQSKINREILPHWKGRPVASIARRDCRELVQAIADRGGAIYANRVVALLSRLFRFAVDEEIVPANPAAHLPKPGVEAQARPQGEREQKAYTADEIRAIWQATETMPAAVCAQVRLGLVTGQRPGEITNMEWNEIADTWWTIPGRRTKNGRDQRVYLTPLATEILKTVTRVDDEPRVFVGHRGKRQNGDDNKQVFAGVRPRLKPRHALRDTVATGLAECGVSIEDIAKVLNHSHGSRVTAGYNAYAYDKEKRLAMGRWARRLAAIIEQKDVDKVLPFSRGA